MNNYLLYICSGFFLFCIGCTGTTGSFMQFQTGNTEVLHSTFDCPIRFESQTVSWMTEQSQLDIFYNQLKRRELSAQVEPSPVVDFSKHGVLLIAMGRQTSAGYSLALQESTFEIHNQTAILHITTTKPDPGLMTAQLITSPCILVTMDLKEYSRIQVLDQNNRIFGITTTTPFSRNGSP